MRLKLRPNYVLAFAIRGKRKIGSLYSPTRGSYSDYYDVQPIWLAEFGDGCKIRSEGVDVGDKGFILDVFELEDLPAYFWGFYRNRLPEASVAEIEKEVEETDGFIMAQIVHEDSIFAVRGGDLCQIGERSPLSSNSTNPA